MKSTSHETSDQELPFAILDDHYEKNRGGCQRKSSFLMLII